MITALTEVAGWSSLSDERVTGLLFYWDGFRFISISVRVRILGSFNGVFDFLE